MKNRLALAVLSASLLLLAGCGDQAITESISPNTDPQARFRVLNFIDDPRATPSIDVDVENLPYIVALRYRNLNPNGTQQATPYRAILTGQRSFVLRQTSERTVTLFSGPINIAEQNAIYSIIFAGTGSAVQPIVLNDAANLPSSNQSRVRIVHAAAAIGALDVYVITTAANLLTAQPSAAAVTLGGSFSINRALTTTTRVVITAAGSKTPLYDAVFTPPTTGGGSTTLVVTGGTTAGTVQVTPIAP